MRGIRWFLHLLWKSLSIRISRIVIATLAIMIGTALITAMFGLSMGMMEKLEERLRAYGANLLIVPKSVHLNTGIGNLNFGLVEEHLYFSEEDMEILGSLSDWVVDYAHSLWSTAKIGSEEVDVVGIYFPQMRKMSEWWKVGGRWPARPHEALFGRKLMDSLGLRLGQDIELSKEGGKLPLKIVGRLETGGSEEDRIYLSMEDLQRFLNMPGKINSVLVRASTHGHSLEEVARRIESAIPGAEVEEVRQVVYGEEVLLRKVRWLMSFVTIAVLGCAGIGVASTMGITVLERRGEIGLLRALGGTRCIIGALFLSEALMMGMFGGILGYVAGILIIQAIAKDVFDSLIPIPAILPFLSMGAGMVIALIASLGPVRTAWGVTPAITLRGE